MKILTKKKLEELEETNYNEGWSDGNSSTTRMWEENHIKSMQRNRGIRLQVAESLEELRKINKGNGIRTKKQKNIDNYISELITKILEFKEE